MDTQIFNKVEEPIKPENDVSREEDIPNLPEEAPADAKVIDEEEERIRKAKKRSDPSKFITGLYDWISALLVAVVVVVLVMTFCFRMVAVDGSSMMDTLQDNDYVFITGLNYEPQVGDIVVISHGVELNKPIVKRVIAVGGQTVDIDFETGDVTVDGVLLDEPYILGSTTVSADVEFPLTVTEGTVFVLGDNRVISKDSRYSDVGLIDVNNIIGKVQLRVYPFGSFGLIE